MRQRIEYIDITKGVGMVLVVIGHMLNSKSVAGQAIWSFHMPLFFLLSGLCFDESRHPSFVPFLKRRVMTLAVPLFLFAVLVHCANCLLGLVNYGITNLHSFQLPTGGWFVLVLFIAELIYYWINKGLEFTLPCCKWLIACMFLVIAILMDRHQIIWTWSLSSVPVGLSCYAFGHLSRPYLSFIMEKVMRSWLALLCIASPVAIAWTTGDSLDLCNNHIPSPAVARMICAYLATMGILYGCMRYALACRDENWLKRVTLWIGRNTLPILLLHMLIISFSCHFFKPLVPSKLLYKGFEFVFLSVTLYASVTIINAKATWMLGKTDRGNR